MPVKSSGKKWAAGHGVRREGAAVIGGSAGRRRIVGHVCIPGIRNTPQGRDGSRFPIAGCNRDALQYLHTVRGPVPCTLVRGAESLPTDYTDHPSSQSTGRNPAKRAEPVVWSESTNVAEAPQPQGVEADATGWRLTCD